MSSAYGISALPSILSGEENSELPWLCHILQVKCRAHGAWKMPESPLLQRSTELFYTLTLEACMLSNPLKSRSQACMLQDTLLLALFLLQPETTHCLSLG